MPKRRYFSESESEEEKNIPIPKKKKIVIQRPRIKFEELPSIKSLDDLIKIAETSKWYKIVCK